MADERPLPTLGTTDAGSFVFIDGNAVVGPFESDEVATATLQAIDQFQAAMREVDVAGLQSVHDRIHDLPADELNDDIRLAHDLLEYEIEARGQVPGIEGDPETKLDEIDATKAVVKRAAKRYTLGPVYMPDHVDGHGEMTDAESLQEAVWGWVQKGDRDIHLQHTDRRAGEMVEILTWPQEVTLDVTVDGVSKAQTFPAHTPFMGVVWDDWAWDLVEKGALRGYSMGGTARRVEVDLGTE